MPLDLTFVANETHDPQVWEIQDGDTGEAYDLTGYTFELRWGTKRVNGDLTIGGTFTVNQYQITDAAGVTWNHFECDPDPDDLLEIDGGTYPIDLIQIYDAVDADPIYYTFDTGIMTIQRGVSV
jgi:hypothetical protein